VILLGDIRLLTFITVAETKSFTKSAEILNITQPAVSQHIKFLEDEYGVNLIKKYGNKFDLTEEGFILLDYAKKIEAMYRELSMRLKNKSSIIKTYKVGASMTIGGYVLPYIIGKYKKLYDNVNILLVVNNTKEILEKLVNSELDFALVEGPFDKSKFKFIKFRDDELILAVSPHHEFAASGKVSIESVLKGNLILREKGSGTRSIFENKLLELGYKLGDINPYMEIGSIDAIKSLIESNLGYSIISQETIKKELNEGIIKKVEIEGVRIFREFNFVYVRCEEFMYEFIDFCCNNMLK
jgi:DNA-binding transcriptional LysR family regulator